MSRHADEIDRLMLHRLAELDGEIREAYAYFDYKKVIGLRYRCS